VTNENRISNERIKKIEPDSIARRYDCVCGIYGPRARPTRTRDGELPRRDSNSITVVVVTTIRRTTIPYERVHPGAYYTAGRRSPTRHDNPSAIFARVSVISNKPR